MVLRNLIRLIITSGEVVAKAFTRAVREEMKAGQQAAAAHGEKHGATAEQTKASAHTNIKHGISLQEAAQILNVSEPLTPEEVQKKYDHLFAVNDKKRGGSFYLQSKVFRAKERLDAEMGVTSKPPSDQEPTENQSQSTNDDKDDSASSKKR
uniref:Mitochondrial import inner membrane translocase subunit tim-16 n=1 Tax=Plectus sambesii TaxID=2011161 RepID=A0A914VB42_9BILA